MFAIYERKANAAEEARKAKAVEDERKAKVADNTRVQDLNNRCIVGMHEILHDGPDAYYKKSGAEAIAAAPAATAKLATLREGLSGQAANQAQRDKLGAILDVHFADAAAGVARHSDAQQEVYSQGVAAAAVETARQAAIADPSILENAAARAQGATRELHRGQPPEVVDKLAQEAGASLFAAVIRDRLSRNDPLGLTLFARYGDRLTAQDRGALGATAQMMADNSAATEWVRTRNAGFTAAPTGDAAVDAVTVASASDTDPPPPVTSSGGLLNQDGVVGYGQRLAGIGDRRRALTALNEQEFAGDPARLQANQRAIDSDAARRRAAVKAESDEVYAGLDIHMRTGGPGGGPAVTLPPPTILSRLTAEQQKSVAAQVDRAVEGKKTRTDQATWYAIHQGLTGDDADERERWAHTNLIQFRGKLSEEDFAALTKRQATARSNDGGAEATRLQMITRMVNRALWTAGIDPTPTQDRAPDSHTVQAVTFRRALDDELSTFESSKGRPATAAEAQDFVDRLATTAVKGGWPWAGNRQDLLIKVSDTQTHDALNEDTAPRPDAEAPATEEQDRRTWVGPITDPERIRLLKEEYDRYRAATGSGGSNGAPATEPDPGSFEYQDADVEARTILAEQDAERTGRQGGGAPTLEPLPGSSEYQTAEKVARQVVAGQEFNEREADRETTRWLAKERYLGSSPKLPPVLAERLSPAEREELEALAATPDTETNPRVYNRILDNLLNYNSQVRLKWAREPLYRYRKSLSPEDFAKLARLQGRLDPGTGHVSGFAPTPADLVEVYDRLAPAPDWHYGTWLPLKRASDGKDWGFALPSSARSFLKGMLDLMSAGHRGELTTDALESFMTLHGGAGRMFGPRGGEGTLTAGGKRRTPEPPPNRAMKGGVPAPAKKTSATGLAKAAESGPGTWRTVNEGMKPRAAAYQTQITGRMATESYVVNGVKLDGYDAGKLLDAKGPGYANFSKNGEFMSFFRGRDELLEQMKRQARAAKGVPITWHVAESAAADAMRAILRAENVKGITIVHTPVLP